MTQVQRVDVILFVADQARSARFYAQVLDRAPDLDVPGMTQLALGPGVALGLMPEQGIARILDGQVDPTAARAAPRGELYLTVDDPAAVHARALAAGARELSPLAPRSWGDDAAYSLDPDGHLLVVARRSAAPAAGA